MLHELNILNFLVNKKTQPKDYLYISHFIKKISLPKFPYDGNYLKNKGIKEGKIIGKTLKLLEADWVKNDFKISDQTKLKIINSQTN